MSNDLKRVLIVDDDNMLLFALGDYLTFRGWSVDCADGIDDARALVRHLRYEAVIVGVRPSNLSEARRLTRDIRQQHTRTHVALLTTSDVTWHSEEPIDADQILGRNLPMAQLASLLCHSIAA